MATGAKRAVPPAAVPPEGDADRAWWDFDTEGAKVVGAFVKAGKGGTRMGSKSPFIVLEVDGVGTRTVWLHWEVLRNQFRREIQERGPIKEGERISIEKGESRPSQQHEGQDYINFRTEFLDREYSQEEIFGVEKKTEEASPAEPPDDGIPFMQV